jgi:succinate-semialdehyde dehydrogenase/glutarate-semialdehyde dehydrogenase
VLRRPLGVVAAIVPWNFPTTLLCNKLGPAFVTGNTVVAKPADTTPFTTLRLAEILVEAGLPPGVLNVVTGTGAEVGEALITHPLTRKVAFTGSTPTGERVMALAARGTKRVTLELGGSDPMIICDDADLARAASAAAMGRFYNCGQACLAIKRVYVIEPAADEVIEAIAGKARRLRLGLGMAEGTQLGPMHSERQRAIMEDQLARTLERGGELVAGGGRPEDPALAHWWFHEPTVVVDPPHDSPMAQEEVFGPALPIWRVRDFDEALRLANDSPFGLGSSIWTSSLERAERAAADIEAGYTWVNSPTKVYDELPFGGVGSSGYGREHGSEALDYYTDLKSVVVRRGVQ